MGEVLRVDLPQILQNDSEPVAVRCVGKKFLERRQRILGIGVGEEPGDPLEEFKRIAQSPATMTEFQNISEYLYKISRKNPAQLQRLAQDWYAYWPEDDDFQKFLVLTEQLTKACKNVRVRFSEHFEKDFNRLRVAARNFTFREGLLDVVDFGHFDLIKDSFLAEQITDLLRGEPSTV
jgi:hypothetical protein